MQEAGPVRARGGKCPLLRAAGGTGGTLRSACCETGLRWRWRTVESLGYWGVKSSYAVVEREGLLAKTLRSKELRHTVRSPTEALKRRES